ncbi:MAG: TrkA family potassium uptake protein [Actinomycetota bacterium]
MYVVIVGGGKVGSYLAKMLTDTGYEVTLVEERKEQVVKIREDMPELNVILGDGCEPYILDESRVLKADAVVAVTGHDEDNIVVCMLAKLEYEVPNTIARINNPKNEWLFRESFGVDVALSNTHMIAKLLQEEIALGDIVTLLKLRKGDVSLVEVTLADDSAAVGQAVKDLSLPAEVVLVTVIHGNELILPKGTTVLQAGDEILAVTTGTGEAALQKTLGSSK